MENYKEELKKLQTQLDELKSKIEKPINKPNNWYKSNSGHLKYFTDETNAYGFRSDNLWTESQNGHTLNRSCYNWYLATPKEVEVSLTKEAVKRGFKGKVQGFNYTVKVDFFYNESLNALVMGEKNTANIVIFNKGTWATPIKTKTIEELAIEFDNYVKNPSNIHIYFKEYLTENKQEIIETLNNL